MLWYRRNTTLTFDRPYPRRRRGFSERPSVEGSWLLPILCLQAVCKPAQIAGLSVGGGTMKRLFVTEPVTSGASESQTNYNASYVNTPFFYMDPYVGLEINLNEFIALLIRIDYMLPFGRTKSDLASLESDVKWSNFMTPSGPRLHVGVLLGKLRNE